MTRQRVIGVAGFKNAGKTTLVERLVTELTGRGYRSVDGQARPPLVRH